MNDPDPVSGWSFPNRKHRVPLFGFLWWKIHREYRETMDVYLAQRVRTMVGFQISDRVFVGVIIGDGKEVEPAGQMNEGEE